MAEALVSEVLAEARSVSSRKCLSLYCYGYCGCVYGIAIDYDSE